MTTNLIFNKYDQGDSMKALLFIVSLFYLSGCGEGNSATVVGNPPELVLQASLADIKAVGLALPQAAASQLSLAMSSDSASNVPGGWAASASTQSATSPSVLLGLTEKGESIVLDDKQFNIKAIKGLKGGFLMEANLAAESSGMRLFFVRIDGKIFDLSTEVYSKVVGELRMSDFRGQNDKRDLFFNGWLWQAEGSKSVFSKIKFENGVGEIVPTNLQGEVSVSQLSGNFVSLSSGTATQILDTVSGRRFNSDTSFFIGLTSTKALVDSMPVSLLDFDRETREPFPFVDNLTGSRLMNDGIVTIQYRRLPDDVSRLNYNERRFYHVDHSGKLTELLSENIKDMTIAAASENYFIFRELSELSYVKRNRDERRTILKDLNILDLKLVGSWLFYRAETVKGELTAGVFDLDNERATEIEDWAPRINSIELIAVE